MKLAEGESVDNLRASQAHSTLGHVKSKPLTAKFERTKARDNALYMTNDRVKNVLHDNCMIICGHSTHQASVSISGQQTMSSSKRGVSGGLFRNPTGMSSILNQTVRSVNSSMNLIG